MYGASLPHWKNGSYELWPQLRVRAGRREDRIGVWVPRPEKGDGFEDKIAAIGIRVKQWVTLHGIAINVNPEPLTLLRHRAMRRE